LFLNPKKVKSKLDDLLTAWEEGENFEPYYSFKALFSKKLLSANKWKDRRTDGQTDTYIAELIKAFPY
jgi:hypothetical protein